MDDTIACIGISIVNQRDPHIIRRQFKSILQLAYDGAILGRWHPLGFVNVTLGTIDGIGTLRWHIWPSSTRHTQSPDWRIHNHVFTVNSFILCGTVSNRIYEVAGTGADEKNRLYQVSYVDHLSMLDALDRTVSCRQRSVNDYGAGDYYTVTKDQYHDTYVEQGLLASTIVLATETDVHIHPYTVGDLHGEHSYAYERTACDRDEFVKLVHQIEESIREL